MQLALPVDAAAKCISMVMVVSPPGVPLGSPTPPADQYSLNDVDPATRRAQLLGLQIAMTTFALILVVLRLLPRYLILKSPGWDDHSIAVAMVRVYGTGEIHMTTDWTSSGTWSATNNPRVIMHSAWSSNAYMGHSPIGALGVYLEGEETIEGHRPCSLPN